MSTLSYEERKERMNELRKAHFYMGFEEGIKNFIIYSRQSHF